MRPDKDLEKCCTMWPFKSQGLKKYPCLNTIKTGWKTKAYNLNLNILVSRFFLLSGVDYSARLFLSTALLLLFSSSKQIIFRNQENVNETGMGPLYVCESDSCLESLRSALALVCICRGSRNLNLYITALPGTVYLRHNLLMCSLPFLVFHAVQSERSY